MSSIYGILNLDQKPVERESLLSMQSELNHFNADAENIWYKNSIGLGHLMLFNTPESVNEKLPYNQNSTGITITADARIDNRDELIILLGLLNQNNGSIPDSILILKAYEKYGENCVKHLIGDFAFAVWDEKNQKIFCARDHMGVKPFFYYFDSRFFVFATEKKGILCLDGINKETNWDFVYRQLFTAPLDGGDMTTYRHIARLKPAHCLTLDLLSKKIQTRLYWDLDTDSETRFADKNQYYEGLASLFDQAVKCRIRTAYPIGTELSGGLDSSAITGAAQFFLKQNGQQIITFSNTLPEGANEPDQLLHDERSYMEDVIALNKIEDFIFVNQDVFANVLDELDFSLKVNDGIESYDPFWQFASRMAAEKKNVRTMLSGFPGDQMVTSLNKTYFIDYLHKKQYRQYYTAARNNDVNFNKFRPFVPTNVVKMMSSLKLKLGYYDDEVEECDRIYKIPTASKNELQKLVNKRRENRFLKSYRDGQKGILLKPMVYNRLEAETRFGLYFRMEPRFPMADIRLTQFYLSMPNEIKYEGDIVRNAYRKAVDVYLPDSIKKRDDKSGSIAPHLTGKGNFWEEYEKLLMKIPLNNPLINVEEVKARLKSHNDAVQTNVANKKKLLLGDKLPTIIMLKWLTSKPYKF